MLNPFAYIDKTDRNDVIYKEYHEAETMKKKDRKKERKEIVESYSFVLQFSINMIVPILACTFAGIVVDNGFDMPYAPVVGFFVGALAGYTSIYKMVKKRLKKENHEKHH